MELSAETNWQTGENKHNARPRVRHWGFRPAPPLQTERFLVRLAGDGRSWAGGRSQRATGEGFLLLLFFVLGHHGRRSLFPLGESFVPAPSSPKVRNPLKVQRHQHHHQKQKMLCKQNRKKKGKKKVSMTGQFHIGDA